MSKKKPSRCKFCGGSSKLNVTYLGGEKEECFCACNKCRCQTAVFATPEEAIAAWNREPEGEQITAESLKQLGFVLTFEYLTKHYNLRNKEKTIRVELNRFGDVQVCVGVNKLPYVIMEHAETMRDIVDLKRLFLNVENEKE